MRGWIFVVLLGACGPRVDVADEGADDSGESADDAMDADASASDSGESAGDGTLETAMFLAWFDEEHRLHISVANHSTPTCEDPGAYPPGGFVDCHEDDPALWIVDVILEPPQLIPGAWDVDDADSPLSISGSTQGPGCSIGGTGGSATLTLEPAPQSIVSGTVSIGSHDTGVLPFSVPLCP